jgi:hypothetical protein
MPVNETGMSQYITDTFEGVDVLSTPDNTFFFFYNPDPNVPPDHKFPWATIVTNDAHDQFSNLNRPSVFRLNIGVGKQTFQSLFGVPEKSSDTKNDDNPGSYDFTALDQLMPHPVYGRMYWVCVLNPGDETFKTKVRPLLDEAYQGAVSKYNRQHTMDKG